MASRIFANNVAGLLASTITGSATSLALVTGQGASFPSPTGGDYYLATLSQGSPPETSWEIVKVTARSDDTLTIVRGQEGTTATSWASGSKVELRLTAGVIAPLAAPASATVDGYLSSTDWATFNGKQAAGTYATGTGTATGTNTGDQTLPVASSTAPAALGTAAVGTGTTFARADHVHPLPSPATLGAAPASHAHATSDVTGFASAALAAAPAETATTIKAALGITTLSGSNTGDQTPTSLGLVIGTDVQAYDADLTTWASVTPGTGITTALAVAVGTDGAPVIKGGALGTPSGATLTNATGLPPAGVTGTALVAAAIGTIVQAYDADLDTWSGITPGSGVGTALGYAAGAANGVATLDGGGKVPLTQLPATVAGAINYQGTWNASTNSPTLVASTGTKGYYYKVATAGTTSIDGNANWTAGDLIIFDGTVWGQVQGGSSDVVSVAGRVGAVTLTSTDVGLNNVANTAQVTSVTGTSPIASSGGTTPAISISAATTTAAGSMSAPDKTKLDAISGTNTGDNAVNILYSGLVTNATHTGDVTGSGALTIANSAVTYAKMQNVSATSRVLGRITAAAGVVEELTGANLATIIGITNTAANVNSVNGVTGAVTAANISAAATSGYGFTPYSNTNPSGYTTNVGTVTGVTGTAPVVSSGGTAPAISMAAATTSVSGYLTSADWNTFNGKQAALGFTPYNSTNPSGYTSNTGTVTGVTGTAPVVSSGGTAPAISMAAASSGVNGYMTGTYATKLDGIAAGATNVTNTNQLTNGAGFITSAGTSAACSGNAATATTATNLSGGTVAATTITATGNITAYYSDDRLKTRTGVIENALDKVDSLDTFYYHANELAVSMGYDPEIEEVGLSAQQVQAIMPEVVAPAPIDPQYLTVRYERLMALAFAAIKELRVEAKQLRG